MRDWKTFLLDTIHSGAAASAATTMAASLCGQVENSNPVAPLNAVSHILFGNQAARAENISLRHTATGLALNTAAVTGWAAMHELLAGSARDSTPARAAISGAAVAATAYVVDYHVVPSRLTPGFEKRLSNSSLALIYGALALSLALSKPTSRQRR